MTKLVECVPNFSEGRDASVIERITAAIASVEGATLLDVDPGEATNRTVVTLVGEPEAVLEAAFRGIKRAAELIDMRKHSGAHARQGATDVCPFVPVSGISVDECVALAKRLGARVGEELDIPVYLYEEAATRPERRSLADIRVGEYEALEQKLAKPEWAPDYGPARFNAQAGATVIGVRPFLIAYNINLNTRDARIAKQIGLTMREKGRAKRDTANKRVRDAEGNLVREPGLGHCRATGWFIEEYGRGQVTMNLTNYEVTPIHVAFDRACELAETHGARVTGSEVVGLVPRASLLAAGRHYLAKQGESTGVSDAVLVDVAVRSMGLDEVAPFEPEQKIIEERVARARPLVSATVTAFAEELAGSSPAPGGGSVAALAGALGAGLVSMVASLTYGKKGYGEHDARMSEIGTRAHALRAKLQAAVDDDTFAFNDVMSAFRLPKKSEAEQARRAAAIEAANQHATEVPLSVLELLPEVIELAGEVADKGNQNSVSDAGVGALMGLAAARGAFYNVKINTADISDTQWKRGVIERADAALARAESAAAAIHGRMLGKL
ncbi:MAG: glutamate formimidoyltransferase [Myxococcales bacterium]|nr:glutamate formimidoyltransferase [Myxococcales bacterium]